MTNTSELQLVESKEIREQYIDNVEVLDRVKSLALLPDNMNTTVEMVANYYEVDIKVIEKNIERNKEELLSDGMLVLKGKQLTDFKSECQIKSRASALTIIPRRAILRIGMLLRDSNIAKEIRTYLLNVEGNTSVEDKIQAILQGNTKTLQLIEQQTIQLITQNTWLVSQNKEIFARNIDMESQLTNVQSEINEMKKSFVFKQYVNPSYKFNDLIHRIGYKFNILNEVQHFTNFYIIMQNWLGEKFPYTSNTKQYILSTYGVEIVENLVNGILIGRIIKSDKGNWIDLNGYSQNDIEFERTKVDFAHSCAYCGIKTDKLLPEHIIPQSKEKSTDLIYNIIPSCHKCNKDKFDNPFKEWYPKQEFYSEDRVNKMKLHWDKYYTSINKEFNN